MSGAGKAQRMRNRLSIDPDAPAPSSPTAPSSPAAASSAPAQRDSGEQDRADDAEGQQPVAVESAHAAQPGRWSSALEDPAIVPGRRSYRSFYVTDPVFARFRAAIHWTSRRQDAAGRVPENMSVAVEEYMDRLAAELERDFNDGEVFPPTPDQVKKARRRRE